MVEQPRDYTTQPIPDLDEKGVERRERIKENLRKLTVAFEDGLLFLGDPDNEPRRLMERVSVTWGDILTAIDKDALDYAKAVEWRRPLNVDCKKLEDTLSDRERAKSIEIIKRLLNYIRGSRGHIL